MKNDILISLEDMDINGNILDISIKGNSIISEVMNKGYEGRDDKYEKDFVLWNNSETKLEENFYDRAYAMYSFSRIKGRKMLSEVCREVGRVVKSGGRLYIWDIELPRMSLGGNYRVRVNLPMNRKGKIYLKTGFNPFRLKMIDLIRTLENNNFKVITKDKQGVGFFLEAAKEIDIENENSTYIT